MLLAITGILRSAVLLLAYLHPTALRIFREFDMDLVFAAFIPTFGHLFPYWAEVGWGICEVGVAFAMALTDMRHRNRLVREMENLVTSKVHAAAIGMVELKGKAIPVDEVRDAPVIRQWVEKDDEGLYGEHTSMKPFYIDDGTGRILVDPRGASASSRQHIFDIGPHQVILKNRKTPDELSDNRIMTDLPPGDYALHMHVAWRHSQGGTDIGTWRKKPREIQLR